jgi:ABC-type uncharacterized transport system ATPase subunit
MWRDEARLNATVPDRQPSPARPSTEVVSNQQSNQQPVVRLSGITRHFGSVAANENVDLDIWRGEIHALLGENGAGKSTLMAILSGVVTPDAGSIFIDGERVAIDSPRAALDRGIGMVHQQFRLFDGFTVAENLFVGWNGVPRLLNRTSLIKGATEICERYGIDLRPLAETWQLSVGQKQRLEILRMLVRGVDVLILDEPTAVLTSAETKQLNDVMNALKRDGKAIVFITHKLQEAVDTADRTTIMRRGRKIAEVHQSQANIRHITRLMIGGDIPVRRRDRPPPGEQALTLKDVSADSDYGLPALQQISLAVRAGEIVGIAGVAGNGQRELIEVLGGLRPVTTGEITLYEQSLAGRRPMEIIRAGVGVVPEDRHGTGLAPLASIWENAILRKYRDGPLNRRGLIARKRAKEYAQSLARKVRLSTANVDALAFQLSGGNAQRLLVGRELDVASRALILAYPTRGLDVAAVAEVHAAVAAARNRGLAVVLVSEDLDELLDISDRIVVLYRGQVAGDFLAGEVDRAVVGGLMAGMTTDDPQPTSREP